MDLAYQGVQGGHAAVQWVLDNPKGEWKNDTLVYLEVKNEQELEKWITKLSYKDIDCSKFIEPDIGDELTAISSFTDKGRLFSRLKLMGSS